ncbi:assimilatory sulfite reductase (NADPH) flavoprotein subunit [Myxococcaceae bacterium JPH2]|nr:assimilatory sulfite reductase (NADPH) flavoprotein subunit [Myxococcaceae bacterium JPH2]
MDPSHRRHRGACVVTTSSRAELSRLGPPPVITSRLGADQGALLLQLLEGMDAPGLQWLSGYAAGLASGRTGLAAAPFPAPTPTGHLALVYGTQTGNSRLLAERLKSQAEAHGVAVRLFRAGEYPLRELNKERVLCVVISTQGDGDPPDDARGFYDFILSRRAPRLESLRFAVLALGDSSYPKYCETGRILDARLAELGATRLLERADCDVDFEPTATGWLARTLELTREALAPAEPRAEVVPLRGVTLAPAHGREAPFAAEVLVNQRITGRGALKDVRHLELSLAGSGLTYEPGDALGVWPRNPPGLVTDVLSALRLDAEAPVTRDGRTLPLTQWLTEELEITRLSRSFLERHAAQPGGESLRPLLTPEGASGLRALLTSHQVIDLVRAHPVSWRAEELVQALRRQTPRLYSLASSQRSVGDEAHLTVAIVDYLAFGTAHVGAASSHLATRVPGEDKVRLFIEPNPRFRLPSDPQRDVIMVGPGTGVAPFRAFVQERAQLGATGRNWLFFGEQHRRSQFLYQTEWQEALDAGTLHRLSVAFSRDQEQKVYVQHRLREQGRELYAWLEGGASLYVCGEAQRMAPDVHAALLDILMTHGGKGRDDAEAYLQSLREQQRYQRDVY